MPLNDSRMTEHLYALGVGIRFWGPRFHDLCTVVSKAAVRTVKGKPFNTTDVGWIIGDGVGIGIGIKALEQAFIHNQIYTIGLGFRLWGPRWYDLCGIIAQSTVVEMDYATLTSGHPVVFTGTGTVIPGSIPVYGPEWKQHLIAYGNDYRFYGYRWPDLCHAVGFGSASNFPKATGYVNITGSLSPQYPRPAYPQPGSGVGTGIIS